MSLATAVFPRVCTTTVDRPDVDLYREVAGRAFFIAGNSELVREFIRTHRRVKWARELEIAKMARERRESRTEARA